MSSKGDLAMNTKSENNSLFKQPSAWIPLAMSLVALAMILGYVAVFGIVQNEDEGAPARIFQLIMLAQVPIAGYFAVKWLPKRPMQTLMVLALQAIAWIIPIVTIIWLESL
jgi:hypothetical protein